MGSNEVPINSVGEEAIKVSVVNIWVRKEERQIFPILNPWHERDAQQVSQSKDRCALCVDVTMYGLRPNGGLLFFKHIQDIRPFMHPARNESAEQGDREVWLGYVQKSITSLENPVIGRSRR